MTFVFQTVDSLLIMVNFTITAIDEHRQTRQFTFALGSLEACLCLIDEIKAMDHFLQRVQLLDEKGVTDLPLETFDGLPGATALEQLEIEWRAILAA